MTAAGRYVATQKIREAVKGRETDVLDGLGILWREGRPHIRCPYPDHGGEADWRWDAAKARARCTCTRGDSIIDVAMKVLEADFKTAKLYVAEALGRQDLIRVKGERFQATDAASLLNPPSDNRNDELVRAYLAHRLGVEPGEVPMPSTPVTGIKALAYVDPPAKQKGKPKLVGHYSCAVFGMVGADGKRHAHRIYVAPSGAGKAELGNGPSGYPRDAKKLAKVVGDDNTSGRSVLWGAPERAPWIILVEGIETGAAIALVFRSEIEAGELLVAAAVSAGGVEAFQAWSSTRRVTIGADRDEGSKPNGRPGSRRGEQAVRAFGMRHHEVLDVAVALPGQPGESLDWLDILRRDGSEAVRAGILRAEPFRPAKQEIEDAARRAELAAELAEIEAIYPLPALESLSLAYRRASSGRILVHKCCGKDKEGDEIWTPVATPFGVPARLRYADRSDAYGLRVVVQGMDGQPRNVDFERAGLAVMAGSEIRSKLYAAGLRIEADGDAVAVQLLKAANPAAEITVLSQPGWHELPGLEHPVFVTPAGEIIEAPDSCPLELAAECRLDRTTGGTLDGWKEAIAAAIEAPGCPHLSLGAIAGFIGPVLALARLDSFGVNLSGRSSIGKTLAQRLAASVWSSTTLGSGLLQSLRTTENAVESIAQAASGTVLALDEMAHVDGKVCGRLIYSLAGGQGKARLTSEAAPRQRYSWTTFALLSGECSLGEKVRADGGSWMAGMAVRFPDIDVTSINRALPRTLLDRIEHVQAHHGHAGPAFVRALVEHGYHARPDDLRDMVLGAAWKLAGECADGARNRAATPFGLLLVAGGLAKEFGLLPQSADIVAIVRWAWGQFEHSSDALALSPDEQIVGNLRAWIAECWDVTVKPTEPRRDSYGNVRGNNREAVAWYDDGAVYVPTRRIREAAGGTFKESQIAETLNRRKLLFKRHSDRRIAVRWVPKIGRVSVYALSRAHFGCGADTDEPPLTVHEGGRR